MSGKEFVDRINLLFSQRIGKPKADLYESCRIPKNSLTNWSQRNTIPGADIALRIANYLNTSVEFLLTGSDSHQRLPPEMVKYQSLSAEHQKMIATMIEALYNEEYRNFLRNPRKANGIA